MVKAGKNKGDAGSAKLTFPRKIKGNGPIGGRGKGKGRKGVKRG